MRDIIKNVIEGGDYNLPDLLTKIDTLWAQGDLNDEERTELKELARSGAQPKAGVDFFAKLLELEARVKALESGRSEGAEPDAEDYVEGRWYYNGDKCLWKGETYVCTAPDGVVCVWSPEAYPAYWSKA